jgi:hypothetical protein
LGTVPFCGLPATSADAIATGMVAAVIGEIFVTHRDGPALASTDIRDWLTMLVGGSSE